MLTYILSNNEPTTTVLLWIIDHLFMVGLESMQGMHAERVPNHMPYQVK